MSAQITQVSYRSKQYRVYPTGTVKVYYSGLGGSGWSVVPATHVKTLEDVLKLAEKAKNA